jgi:hypothetical protein
MNIRSISVVTLLLAGIIVSLPVVWGNDDWHSICVGKSSRPDLLTDHTIRPGLNGHPRMACGGDALYFARMVGVRPWYEVVDGTPDVGAYASLWVVDERYGHISYYDAGNGALKYAYEAGDGWQVETVDSDGDAGRHSSVAVDSIGRTHIVYQADDSLRYARKSADQWAIALLVESVASNSSISVDSSNRMHACYCDAGTGQLVYRVRGDAGWENEVIDTEGADLVSLILDVNEIPHVSYCRDGNVLYAVKSADQNEWQRESLHGITASVTSVAADSAGNPHIVYRSSGTEDNSVRYIRHDGDGWVEEWMDPDVGVDGGYPSITINDDDDVFIFYLCSDRFRHNVKCAFEYMDRWTTKPLPLQLETGCQSSLVLDNQDRYQMTSCRNNAVDYRWYDGEQWHVEVLGTSYPEASCLVLDAEGAPHIVFNDSHSVHYAFREGSEWQVETVFDESLSTLTGDMFCLDSDGCPHLCYYDFTFSGMGTGYYDVKHAWRDQDGWHSENVASFFYFMSLVTNVSIAVDRDDIPHITYHDYELNNLVYASKANGSWSTGIVESGTHAGRYNSLKISRQNTPVIAYTGYGCVKYAVWDGQEWVLEIVEGVGDGYCLNLDMVLDMQDQPHLSYYTKIPAEGVSTGTWKHATKDENGWHITAIVSDCYYGYSNSSIVLDSRSEPHFSFTDGNSNDMKIVWRYTEPAYTPTPSPTPTPTPEPYVGVTLWMPAHYFSPGDPCSLIAQLHNEGDPLMDVHLFIMLQVGTEYWFWPSWGDLLNDVSMDLPHGGMDVVVIPEFIWPDTGNQSVAGLLFWGALMNAEMTEILGGSEGIGMWEFGFGSRGDSNVR